MASAYLTRTITTSTDNTKFTISVWSKKAANSSGGYFNLINSRQSGTTSGLGLWWGNDSLFFNFGTDGSTSVSCQSTAKYRDISGGWYHVVVAGDASQSGTDKLKFWVNGEQVTSFSTDNRSSFATIANDLGDTTYPTIIGRKHDGTYQYDGSMAHFHFVDGSAYSASTFGETDSDTGNWKPITGPSVTYGNNGFFLKFDNAGSMGTDSSGNGNHFSVNGTISQTQDTPSNVFSVFNPLYASGSAYSYGNTHVLTVSGTYYSRPTLSTLGMRKGKYYAEVKLLAPDSGDPDYSCIGISGRPLDRNTGSEQYQHLGAKTYDYAYYSLNGHILNNSGSSNTDNAYGNSYTTNDIIGIAVDLDNNYLYFSKNGVWQNSGDPESGATGTGGFSIVAANDTTFGYYHFGVDAYHYTPRYNFAANFGNGYFDATAVSSAQNPDDGNGIFEYDVPAGYRALCTKSINAEEYS